ncbi:diphthamide synthase [Starmerella bacillaris]|uniref:Diphthamide synthase n=1 Tax=Starmerella bacillaris TaxID=1247836 RepID=A0AAV5RFT2_STABA|nr:diphthamide synthase [Starmerella bacillaris]
MIQTEKIVNTDLPPCVVKKFCGGVVVGTYELDRETGEKSGSLDLYNTDTLELVKTVPTPFATLDIKVHDGQVYAGNSNGGISIYNKDLTLVSELRLDHVSVTMLNIRGNLLAAVFTSGDLVLFDLEKQAELLKTHIHSCEAWTVLADKDGMVYSGGDDRVLACTDPRINAVIWKTKPHDAGVTSLLKRGDNDLWTGGYDDCVKVFDVRSQKVKESKNLGGGVWRLIANMDNSRVMACCMYGGLRILDSNALHVRESLTNHDSMVYGGTWLGSNEGVSISFYDKMLQKWTCL